MGRMAQPKEGYMYEKPQYMTGKGLRRSTRDPLKKREMIASAQKTSSDLKQIIKRKANQPITISKETAKAIAMALKAMLKQK
jgi:hypothetical protein